MRAQVPPPILGLALAWIGFPISPHPPVRRGKPVQDTDVSDGATLIAFVVGPAGRFSPVGFRDEASVERL